MASRREKQDAEPSTGKERGPLARRWLGVLRGFFFGKDVDDATNERLREIAGILMVGGSLWLVVAMLSYSTPFEDPTARGWNWGGQAGFFLANYAFMALGYAGLLAVLLGLAWGAVLVAGRRVSLVGLRSFGALSFVLSTAYLLHFWFGADLEELNQHVSSHLPYGPGGYLAAATTPFLIDKFGGPGLFILLILTSLVSFLLATEMAFYPSVKGFQEWLAKRREERGESLASAVAGYLTGLGVGLWSFVRGADLSAARVAAADGAGGAALLEPGAVGLDVDEEDSDAELKPVPRKSNKKTAELVEIDVDELEEEIEDELDLDDEDDDDDDDEEEEVDELEDELDADDEDSEEEDSDELLVPVVAAAALKKSEPVKTRIAETRYDPPTPPPGPWTFPPVELLIPPDRSLGVDDKFLEDSAAKLENALRSFRVEASVVSAQVGPAVTLFELTVAQGTRMNKVTQLSQEIAAALRAQSVRVIAPIPGRETIGIEVPNLKRRVVRISELVNQKAYDPKYMALPIFIGMDAEGGAIVEDLARMPHLLIAGTTGSGKSVCINTILASLLLTRSPHDVKLILIDPKMVELQAFATVPHLMCPVVTDARQATSVLLWIVEKMEGRYELFKSAQVKNLKGYNALTEDELKQRLGDDWSDERTPRHLPYIVVVIDEFADLMAVSKKEAELTITRLAQKSRAAGFHVIVATQRPSTDVITGVIKGNLPTRIAFQVASKVDSRVILDEMGADKLLGHGDMLFMPPGGGKLRRVQGALVEDVEVTRLVDFVSRTSAPTFSQELVQVASGEARPVNGDDALDGGEEDSMFDEAVRVILKSKRGSASLLQRALGIGYTRASRLIDIMTERGIVGPHRGSKVREILVTLQDWEEMHGPSTGGTSAPAASQGASDE